MEFPKTTKREDDVAFQEGLRIFGELKKKYCNESTSDLDIVLNALCAALIRLAELNIREKDHVSFVALVNTVLMKNLFKPGN